MAAGFDPALFWTLTPREIGAHFEGARKRIEREHDERAWLAWHTAALGRTKDMPKLERLLARPKPQKNWEDMLALVTAYDKRINAPKRDLA